LKLASTEVPKEIADTFTPDFPIYLYSIVKIYNKSLFKQTI
jgi:hypothetical protein